MLTIIFISFFFPEHLLKLMPKNLRHPARVKKKHLRKLLKTAYEEAEDEVEVYKFNSTI